MNKTLVLIDGNSLFFRAYYGTLYNPQGILRNSNNIPINAILTFARMIIKIINDFAPSHLLVAFDTGKKTIRHNLLETYKAKRIKAPVELQIQFPIAQEFLDSLGVKHFSQEGYEADDIIGSLSHQWQHSLTNIYVISSDRDLLQLVNVNTSLVIPQNGSKKPLLINYINFEKTYHLLPTQIPDFKGLVGDKSDNLPGVAGIGEKTALSLLRSYGSIENIYDNLSDLPEKMQEKLTSSHKMAFLSKKLGALDLKMKLPFGLSELIFNPEYHETALIFFKKYELFSLIKQFEKK